MLRSQWIKGAEKNGWRVDRSSATGLRLRCCKQGCPGHIEVPFSNLGPVPSPCDLPHAGQYSGPTFNEYRALVKELTRRRRCLGLSQEDINNAAGLADGHLNKLEAFHRTAQFPTLQLWAATVGMEITLQPAPLPDATARAIERRPAPYRDTTRQRQLFDDR